MKTTNVIEQDLKLFAGEKLLVFISLFGFALAAFTAVYIGMNGALVLPEGNLESAFSFDAALAVFTLSIAALLPVSGMGRRRRAIIRRFFIIGALYAFAVETIQHFRGINPRFTKIGSVGDQIAGGLFGLDSILLIVTTVFVAIPFFRKRPSNDRPLLVLGIRYAFLSTMLAFTAGVGMIVLQSRYTGLSGNLIVLHGLGFHALQTLPLIGWLLERAQTDARRAKWLIHVSGITWMISVVLIGIQTVLGRSVFELTALPLLSGAALLISLAAMSATALGLYKASILTYDNLS